MLYLIYGTKVIDLRFVIPMLWYTFVGMTQPAIRAFEFACNLGPICKSGKKISLFEILLDSLCKEGHGKGSFRIFRSEKEVGPKLGFINKGL